MMKKMKSNPWMKSKALYVIPVAALALSAFATPKFVAPIEETVTKLEGKGTENSPNLQAFEKEKEKIKVEEASGATMIRVRGDNAQPLIVLNGKIIDIPEDAKDSNSEEQLAKLLDINVEDIGSIVVLQKDAAVAKWGDKGSNGVIVIATKNEKKDVNKNDSIYNVAAVRAQFPGGDPECFKFIAENVRYPKLCHEFGVQGRVIVSFVVEKDGSITEIKKERAPSETLSEGKVTAYKKEHPDSEAQLEAGQDLGELLYEEAERVVKLMPKWEPAKDKDGNVVRSRFTLPVMFRLQ